MLNKEETEAAFKEAYAALNAAQREAVDTIDGPVMVIAGPGTGKTQILALRIANILLKTDTKPENILALTFTDAGAHAMRARLRRYIGEAAFKVAIHTFHSFCGEQIRRYPDAYPNIIGGRVISDLEKLALIEDLINSGEFKLLRPTGDPAYYVRELPSAFADLKKEYITPDILSERIGDLEEKLNVEPKHHEKGAHKGKVRSAYLELEKRINKLRELLHAYRLYQAALRDRRLYDYEDMIVETVAALRDNEDMRLDLQETYQYLLADEHQDVNEAQNKILELLADYHEQPNIFVVGDEKQAIYRFQGASLSNFLFFEDRFKNTKTISLTNNYRSTQNILDAAHELIQTDDEELGKLRIALQAAKVGGMGRLEYRNFSHEAVEDGWVVEEVKKALAGGIPAEEIAIIVRRNRDVEHFTNLLRQNDIDALPSADSDILQHPITLTVECMLRAVIKLDDESALFDTLLGPWWEIETGDLARVFAARTSSWPLYRLIADEEKLAELNIKDPARLLRAGAILDQARAKLATDPPHQILHFLIKESGFLDHVMKEDPLEGVRVLRRLYNDIEAMVVSNQALTLREVVSALQYRRQNNLPLLSPFIESDQTAVRIMTAHKAKGLEYHTVILPRATDKAYGGGKGRDLFKLPLIKHDPLPGSTSEDDDRRLFYVAMTRAKHTLLISASESDIEGKLFEPTRFLSTINEEFIPQVPTDQANENFDAGDIFKNALPKLRLEPALIKDLFLARGFSVTHLNNYLEDPLKYYNENLLRKPHPRSLSLLRGEAVHAVLERSTEMIKREGQAPSTSLLSDWLRQALERLPIGDHDFAMMHERSLAALAVYIPTLVGQVTETSRNELSMSVVLKTDEPDLPEIPLTGKLDRVDFAKDGSIIRVVDYKTGKPKSRNEVEGTTKNSNGNYKRQLVFYALLLSLQEAEHSTKTAYTLSFVEPRENSGELVEYAFNVTPEEVEELKREVIRVAKEIVSGEKFK